MQGDIRVVQVRGARRLAEFDRGLLAPYTGDIAAEVSVRSCVAGLEFTATGFNASSVMPLKAITERVAYGARPLEVAWFAETAAVERAVDSLTTRLEKLRPNDAVKYGAYISSSARSKLRQQ